MLDITLSELSGRLNSSRVLFRLPVVASENLERLFFAALNFFKLLIHFILNVFKVALFKRFSY